MSYKMALPAVKNRDNTPIPLPLTRGEAPQIKRLFQTCKTFEIILSLLAFVLLILGSRTMTASVTKLLLIAATFGAIICYLVVCLVFSLRFTKYPSMILCNLFLGIIFIYLTFDALNIDWTGTLDKELENIGYKQNIYLWATIGNGVLFLIESVVMQGVCSESLIIANHVHINNYSV